MDLKWICDMVMNLMIHICKSLQTHKQESWEIEKKKTNLQGLSETENRDNAPSRDFFFKNGFPILQLS